MKLSTCIVTHNHEDTIFESIKSIVNFINIKDYEIYWKDPFTLERHLDGLLKVYKQVLNRDSINN